MITLIQGLYQNGARSRPGPVLHYEGEDVVVDVWAFHWHVYVALRINPSTGGSFVNATALEFEEAVQRIVDESPFAPPSALRELRGRTLRIEGRDITDLDALIVVKKTLYLVSCKRFVLGVEYLAGDYRTVRNARSRVELALDEWAARVQEIRGTPVGDNYDFSGYAIDGFVVGPELLFTPRADSREQLQLGIGDLFFTRLESFDQLAGMLSLAAGENRRAS